MSRLVHGNSCGKSEPHSDELECREPSPDLQLRELAMQSAKYARIVACYIENLEPLHVEVAIEHLDE